MSEKEKSGICYERFQNGRNDEHGMSYAQKIEELIKQRDLASCDCRTCGYFDNARTRCRSITICNDASNYEDVPFVQLWVRAK